MFKKPSVKDGWTIVDTQPVQRIDGPDFTRILWGKDGKVKTTTVLGSWEYEIIVSALGQPL